MRRRTGALRAPRFAGAVSVALFTVAVAASSDASAADKRLLPPPGDPLPEREAAALARELAELDAAAAKLHDHPLLPDAEVYLKAVRLALEFDEFYDHEKDVAKAERALQSARERLDDLAYRRSPWAGNRGFVVRGYRSEVDGSAQPYGLEIPEGLDLDAGPVPLYVWLHGRGDKNTDLHFIDDRTRKHWPFHEHLDDGIVLHPFGRQCLGYKSAGETDVLDAVRDVGRHYNIDQERIALMGFSMGGAGAWHLAAHYPYRWAVAHAGAGFVDVQRYRNLTADQMPPAVEQLLWGQYDVPAAARNLLNLPVIAYSGEDDKQRDAADYMAEVLATHGRTLPHVIGPGTGHKYHPDALDEVSAFIRDRLSQPKDRAPKMVHLQTRTLHYSKAGRVYAAGLGAHWKEARVDAEFGDDGSISVTCSNVTALALEPPHALPSVTINGDAVPVSDANVPLYFHLGSDGTWRPGSPPGNGPRKRPGLQGPIDDAFVRPFAVVPPSPPRGTPASAVDEWVASEYERFVTRWRATFRGDLRVVSPDSVATATGAAKNYNLVLFGTPESNPLIAEALEKCPLQWDHETGVQLGDQSFSAKGHVPVLIYPNPAAPSRYVVINSGPTFREAHNRTNSLQNPKLGDYAVIDITSPPDDESPGRVVAQGFFDEQWQLPESQPEP